ncbi:hypothetical protein PENDEC_c028G04495 [Penicillium decumbens]|uniref:Uncharacterized protein n=1 Tax=Penicillium decumbens TaxID=69771 RepID=A0A1V6NZ44_PENDC|nr:hypothetical protein PENDEC_c028G04495 [Penicillium decumbens]
MNSLHLKHHNRSQIRSLFLFVIDRAANLVREEQTKKAEDPDEEDVATVLDEAGKDRMESKAKNHSNINQDGNVLHPETVTDGDPGLRADAPDFVPGAPTATTQPPHPSSAASAKGKSKAKAKVQPKLPRVTTKSTAGDIATRIHEDIAHNLMAKSLFLHAPGAVRDAISRMKYSRPPTPAGVRRKLILDPSLVSPHIHVVRHAHGLVKGARIHVTQLAMPVLVLLVHQWDQLKIAFVVEIPPPNGARTLIMSKDGAVERSAVICFHVASIHVLFHVTKACVVPVRSRLRLVVIAAKCRQKCYAALKRTKWKATQSAMMDLKKSGLGALVAVKPATVHSIVVYILAKRAATHKTRIPPIVLARQMSWFVVRVEKHR